MVPETPALFTMMSRPPKLSTAAATSCPDLFRIGDVCPAEQSVGAERCGQRFTHVRLNVGDDDPCALGHKLLHRAAPDTGSTAGDDGYLAGQFVDHTTS